MKNIASITVAVLLLAGCASRGGEKPSCSSPEACVVVVTVKGCSDAHIAAQPDVLKVRRGYRGDIVWRLEAAPGWEFAANGIEFKDAKNPEFARGRRGARDFRWYDNNTRPGTHHYSINVTPPGGGKSCSKDPTIMNDQEP